MARRRPRERVRIQRLERERDEIVAAIRRAYGIDRFECELPAATSRTGKNRKREKGGWPMATQIQTIEMAARPSWAERLHDAIGLAERFPATILALMMRIGVGAIFLKSGLTKIANFDITISLFQDEYMVPLLPPALAAVLATAIELGGSALILAGLATRLAVLPLLAMTFVIEAFVYPENWVEHLTWASMLLFLFANGAGRLSLDHGIKRVLDRRWGYS
jgi:putative oxidoreductase